MARLSAEERAQLDALSQRAKAEDDEDAALEVWVKNEKGHEVKLTGSKARRFMAQFGLDDDEQAGDEQGDQGGDEQDPKPEGGFWGRKPK